MNITELVGALVAHRYLFVFVLLAAYARRLTQPDSSFPLTVPDAWRPVITAFCGLVYGVLATVQGGASWSLAILGGVIAAASGGFADMLLVAVFGDASRVPASARAIAFVFHDLKGGATGSRGGAGAPPDPNDSGTSSGLHRTGALVGAAAAGAFVAACSHPLPPQVPNDLAVDYACVEGDLSRGVTSFAQIEADCSPGQIQSVVDLVDWILAKPERAQKYAALVPKVQSELRLARAEAAR